VNKYSIIALVLLSLVGPAVVAQAQEEGIVIVTVPFEFFAGSKMLPAGKYAVSSLSSATDSLLIVRSTSNSALLLPVAFDGVPVRDVKLSFEQVGDAHLLSEVRTQMGTYSINTGQEAAKLTKLARTNVHTGMGGMTSSGTP
jgi:hypothetical protein